MEIDRLDTQSQRLVMEPAVLADLAALEALEEECDRYFAFDPPGEPNHNCSVRDCLLYGDLPPGGRRENYHFLKISRGGSLVGFLAYYLGYPEEDSAYLSVLYIGEAHRHSGLGGQSVRHLMEQLRLSGLRAVHLHVSLRNAMGLAFWVRQGFDRIVDVQYTGNLLPGKFAGMELRYIFSPE